MDVVGGVVEGELATPLLSSAVAAVAAAVTAATAAAVAAVSGDERL